MRTASPVWVVANKDSKEKGYSLFPSKRKVYYLTKKRLSFIQFFTIQCIIPCHPLFIQVTELSIVSVCIFQLQIKKASLNNFESSRKVC